MSSEKRRSYVSVALLGLTIALTVACVIVAAITLSKVTRNATSGSGGSGDQPTARPSTVSPTTSKPPPNLNWWKYSPIYQIYPRSFQDSDGDGTGDIQGIKQRVSYLRDLGIKAIWLSPVYKSPMADFGYDISNFTDVDPAFGTLQDFKELIDEVHKHDMYLIMDFVPNHSSNEHEWFERSRRNETPYNDYYVWRNEPNNWISIFGNTTWEYDTVRQQYYLHQFLIEQPDLNYRNEKLKKEMMEVLRTWLDRGVDGFRMDAIIYLVEDSEFRDEALSGEQVPENNHAYLYHNYTQDLPETYESVREWTAFFRKYGQENNRHVFACTEGYTDVNNVMKYYSIGVDFPFNFNLINLNKHTKASTVRDWIRQWMDYMPAGSWPNWVVGNHDQHRVASRLGGREYVDVANMLLLLLPGTPTCYYGDEIGMVNANISFEDSVDPAGKKWGPDAYMNFTRDPERTPMQWDNTKNAGFSNANKTWLPMSSEWQTYNVENELKDANSHLNIFKKLVALRKEPAFLEPSNLRLLDVGDEDVFAFTRELNEARYVVLLNLGDEGKIANVHTSIATGIGEVVVASRNANHTITQVDFSKPLLLTNAQGYVIKV